jgi:hypothetical protein
VDPAKITYTMDSQSFHGSTNPSPRPKDWEFSIRIYHGLVKDGGWDSLERKFNELDFYESYRERVINGTSWDKLYYYQRVWRQIENGVVKWGCKNKKDLDRRCQRLDDIYNDIKQNGCKSRAMLAEEAGGNIKLDGDDEIGVNIGRQGDIIFNNGRHRLALAKIAGVDRVPVQINVRHKEWEKFVKEIEVSIKKNNSEFFAPLSHIGLRHISVQSGDEDFALIQKNLGRDTGSILDIGAQWGYFCHKFEQYGFSCIAVEDDPEKIYFLEKLRRAENRNFNILKKSLTDLCNTVDLDYDVILGLHLIDSLLVGEITFQDFTKFLNKINARELYLEIQTNSELNIDAEVNITSFSELIEYVSRNSCFNHYKIIGKYSEYREIYKLWR